MAAIYLATLVVWHLVVLQPAVAPAPATAPDPQMAPSLGVRSYSQHALTKIRQGSYLRGNGEPKRTVLDLRSHPERRRDAELMHHYSRLAQIDAIAEWAEKANETSMLEQAEQLRRQETRRFYKNLRQLRELLLQAADTWRELGRMDARQLTQEHVSLRTIYKKAMEQARVDLQARTARQRLDLLDSAIEEEKDLYHEGT